MKTKFLWLAFLGVFSCFVHGQTVINTNHPNNNGNGSVTFEVQNTNPYDIIIIGVQCHLGTTATNNIELLYNTSPYVDSSPPWSFGTVGAGQNGWISAGTGVVSNSNTANGIVPVLTSLSLIIPAGATYQLGLSATTMQYSTLTSGAGINTFSGGGVNLLTGDGISWGGTVYPATPANYPRGLIGGITFIPAIHFAVSAPATATAGTAFNFTVTAQDALNNTLTGYTGTVHFTSTDGAALLPADATLTNGTGTFSATLKTAGSPTISATDTVTAAMTGTSAPIAVNAGAATHFSVSTPANSTAGASFTFTVTALDSFDNTDTAYAGTVHFTSSDGTALLPADATLSNGVGTFNATLKTAGSQTLAATDTVTTSITGSAGITVDKAATTTALTAAPATTSYGQSVTLTAAVSLPPGNADTATGTVDFSDGGVAITGCSGVAVDASGNATCTTASLAVGVRSLRADYLGDGNTDASFGTLQYTVANATTAMTLTAAPNPAIAGQVVTLTATLTASGSPTLPTGTVEFFDGTTSLGSVALDANGVAVLTLSSLAQGTHALSVVYAGGGGFASASAQLSLVVSALPVLVPTPALSEWMLMLLAALMVAVGVRMVRER
jgi:hypothetical protein